MAEAEMATVAMTPERFRQQATQVKVEVGKMMVGQTDVIELVLIALLAGGHALIEGVPGLGKTMLIRTLGQVLALQFSRIQFTPDLMPMDITGTDIMEERDGKRHFRFQPGPVFANLLLADEINRATPKTQSAMLEAMQERTVTVSDQSYPLPAPFFVLATQNPLEQEGTYPLPEAQLDRFMFKIDVGYPSAAELVQIVARTTGVAPTAPQAVVDGAELLAMQALAREVPLPSDVAEYVARLVIASHPADSNVPAVKQYVRYGASPRAAQAIVLGAKVRALLAGRYNVSYGDCHAVARPALRHRLLLNFEGQAAGVGPDGIIDEMLATVARS